MDNEADTPPDFKIARDGAWWHDGAQIKRAALAKLFADRALVIDENGDYWLQTPYEKYPVEVEDVPFIIIDYDRAGDIITMKTNMHEDITINKDTAWELREGIPYVEVRKGLFARIGRSILYNLIEEHGAAIKCDGQNFPLGEGA